MSAFSELCVSGSGKDGCGRGTLVDIQVLLDCLMSPVEDLRYIAVKGLLSMIKVLPSVEDRNESNEVAKFLVQRVYVAQFDAADRVKARAKEYALITFLSTMLVILLLLFFQVME